MDRCLLAVASPPQAVYCALGCVRGMEHWSQVLCALPWLLKHTSNIIIMSINSTTLQFSRSFSLQDTSQHPEHQGDVSQAGC